jgi:CoA:oxalate CoA-transferase
MQRILDGVRVLDLTQYLSGPSATLLLAQLGAEVIKVELGPDGDPSRQLPVARGGRSGYFVQQNRGKRSVCVDFARPESWQVLRRLAGTVDVVIENFGPGVLDRRGIDMASLRELHPRLVTVSISAFGREGPWSHKLGYDQMAQALGGVCHLTGHPDGPPLTAGVAVGDLGAGLHAFAAIGYALFHRDRTGRGQHLDVAMVDGLFCWQIFPLQAPSVDPGFTIRRNGPQSPAVVPSGVFKGPEGWLVMLVLDRQWDRLCAAMGRPDWVADERTASGPARLANREYVIGAIEAWMASFPTDEALLAHLDAHRIPCAPVIDPATAPDHEYFRHRELVREVADPVFGTVRVPGMPIRFSEPVAGPDLPAPLLGADNGAVLAEAGFTEEEIAELVAAGLLLRADDR